MALVPDVCFEDAKTELVTPAGEIRHAALTLYGYYCARRNKETGAVFPKLETSARVTGIPKTNVSRLNMFLEEKKWIRRSGRQIILLKGFPLTQPASDDDPSSANKVAFSANKVAFSATQKCNKRNSPLKVLNQPKEPAQRTSEGADSAKRETAAPDSLDSFDSFDTPAGTPGRAAPAVQPAPRFPAGKPAAEDRRIKHKAVKMVREITGRFAPKSLWDKIIREIGADPDAEFFRASFEIWSSFGGNPTNLDKWLFEPNERKSLPERFGEKFEPNITSAGESRTPAPPPDAHAEGLKMLIEAVAEGWDVSVYEKYYQPEEWQRLMEQLQVLTKQNY